jgi:hypothetical protein
LKQLLRSLIVLIGIVVAVPATAQTQPTPEQALALQQEAAPFVQFAQRVESVLVQGDGEAFRSMLSPTGLAAASKEQVDAFVNDQVLPFFKGYQAAVPNTTITRTKHPSGYLGFAFYRAFTTTDGQTRPFVLYIVNEDGKLVIGNLLVGKTYQDLHPQQ